MADAGSDSDDSVIELIYPTKPDVFKIELPLTIHGKLTCPAMLETINHLRIAGLSSSVGVEAVHLVGHNVVLKLSAGEDTSLMKQQLTDRIECTVALKKVLSAYEYCSFGFSSQMLSGTVVTADMVDVYGG